MIIWLVIDKSTNISTCDESVNAKWSNFVTFGYLKPMHDSRYEAIFVYMCHSTVAVVNVTRTRKSKYCRHIAKNFMKK